MKLAGQTRRIASAVVAGVLVVVGLATPAHAAASDWSMLVNDYYDGYQGHRWCLSTNAQTSNSGAGTHFVYLAVCTTSTPGQWWSLGILGNGSLNESVQNYQDFGNTVWELSANGVTPAGGDAGTYGAYTAAESNAPSHYWEIDSGPKEHAWWVENASVPYELSASASNPELPGTLRVYSVPHSTADTHVWRPWQPTSPPSCSPCGNF